MSRLRGQLLHDEPMAKHTSWRVGGSAEMFYKPADLADLQMFVASLPEDQPIHWLGLGSNVLVRDGGLPGATVATLSGLRELSQLDDGRVRAEAGVTCAKLAKQSVRWGFAGGAFFAGIPGTVGGALAMNAGAFGGETWERVVEVETVDRHGEIIVRTPADYQIAYREVQMRDSHQHDQPAQEWFVAAIFQFEQDVDGLEAERIKTLLAKRNETQPTNQPSCGSTFRNPAGDFAARLIEASGLKGFAIGGAQVSEKHANFLINTGTATAADIEALADYVAEVVNTQQGVELVREFHVMGLASTAAVNAVNKESA